jgi:TolB-like protein/tetratricopeptide (TPR) repeat protein
MAILEGGSRKRLRTESQIFQFGVFRFNPETLELTKNGLLIALQPQPARLLGLLLSSAGGLVTRDLIQDSLWGDGTTVDFEVGVNRYIRQLRLALDDDAETPRYIKTMPRLGYCFIAPLTEQLTGQMTGQTTHGPSAASPLMAREPEPQPSIAVLPFANLSGNPENEYFSDGLTEEITSTLAQIGGLRVIARTSAFAFKGKSEDIRKIAEALRVQNLLEGSVRRSADRIRVTVQLIAGPDGANRWSKRYDREMTDVFALQDEISADIAKQLKVSLPLPRQSTVNFPAFEAYLEGRFHWHRYSPEEFEKAVKCFERAVAIDSAYAQAYTGIAQSRLGLVTEGGVPALEMLPKAAAAARRALELDRFDAEAHAVLGQTAAMLDYDWVSAKRHLDRALELDPVPYVRTAYAVWFLIPQGRPAEAVAQADRVIQDDPLHLIGRVVRAISLMFAGDLQAATDACQRLLEIDAGFPKAIQCLSFIAGNQGRFAESAGWAERLVALLGKSYASLYTLAQAHAVSGNAGAAHRVLADLENLPGSGQACPARIGLIYGLLGDADRAFGWLEQAIRYREPTLLWMKSQPRMACLRQDRRFASVLQTLNL